MRQDIHPPFLAEKAPKDPWKGCSHPDGLRRRLGLRRGSLPFTHDLLLPHLPPGLQADAPPPPGGRVQAKRAHSSSCKPPSGDVQDHKQRRRRASPSRLPPVLDAARVQAGPLVLVPALTSHAPCHRTFPEVLASTPPSQYCHQPPLLAPTKGIL